MHPIAVLIFVFFIVVIIGQQVRLARLRDAIDQADIECSECKRERDSLRKSLAESRKACTHNADKLMDFGREIDELKIDIERKEAVIK